MKGHPSNQNFLSWHSSKKMSFLKLNLLHQVGHTKDISLFFKGDSTGPRINSAFFNFVMTTCSEKGGDGSHKHHKCRMSTTLTLPFSPQCQNDIVPCSQDIPTKWHLQRTYGRQHSQFGFIWDYQKLCEVSFLLTMLLKK